MDYVVLLLPLVIATCIALRWRDRPVIRALVMIPTAGWVLLAAWGMWEIRNKPVFGRAPEFGQRYEDFVAGAYAMSDAIGNYYFVLCGALTLMTAGFVLDGFLRRRGSKEE